MKCGISYAEITPTTFSFNSPYGACTGCNGLGEKFYFDPSLVVPDPSLSIIDGAIVPWSGGGRKKAAGYYMRMLEGVAAHYGISIATPFGKLPKKIREVILNGSGAEEIEFDHRGERSRYTYTQAFEGVLKNLERRHRETTSDDVRDDLERYMNSQPCPDCLGSRLKRESLFIKVGGRSIWEVVRMSIKDALVFFSTLELNETETEIARRVLKEVGERLFFLSKVGLDYITLDRSSGTLSGGEGQRIRLATQIGSSLVGVLYILDEPSIGLHQRDNRRLLDALKRLRDMGNTVLVVEHDEETIREADHVIDMGPGAGEWGGMVVAEGTYADIISNERSLTGKYLSGVLSIPVPMERKKPGRRSIGIRKAVANNLKGVDVDFPIGLMTCVTGVSGSGKSTLVVDTLYKNLARRFYGSRERPGKVGVIRGLEYIDKVIDIDQSPIGRTPRSNPATYTGLFTPVRELFSTLPESRVRGYNPGRFSFNVRGGRCEACKGDGLIKVEMHFLPDVYVVCDVCRGNRYNRDTLEIRFRGKNISECLDMTVTEGLKFFENIPNVRNKLQTLFNVGLGYIRLGQPSTTLSGGEAQRIKLSKELSKRATGKTLYILDEPTTGLHFADIKKLLDVLISLRDAGNTIIIIEHNLDVIKSADRVVDLGPEGGDGGGTVVAVGTPEEIARVRGSYTGEFLKHVLKAAGGGGPVLHGESDGAAPSSRPGARRQKAAPRGA
jgi:excinuclease ABC subunit A